MIKEENMEEIEDEQEQCIYVPDKKIDRYSNLKNIMFDERPIKEVVKTIRVGTNKRILYKDLQIGKVYYYKSIITHQDVDYTLSEIGDLTVFEFVNNLPGLEGINPDNVLRLDKLLYEKKNKK